MKILRGISLLFAFLFALVLLIGGRNAGMGVGGRPHPLAGLIGTALGLSIWCALSRVVMRLRWFRTFLVASYTAFTVLAVQAFAAAYVGFGRLSDTVLGEPRVELKSTVVFNIGTGVLSLVCIYALHVCTREHIKIGGRKVAMETKAARAIQDDDAPMLAAALDSGADPNEMPPWGLPLLHAASEKGDPLLASILLQSGADVNIRSKFGEAAIHVAAKNNHHGILIILLEHKADLNVLTEDGDSALHKAAQHGSRDATYVLLTRGANPNIRNPRNGRTPLHDAARNNHADVAGLLLDKGGLIEAKDSDGCTPLIVGAQSGAEQMVKLLLDQKADPNESDQSRRTALIWAATKGDWPEVMELLLRSGANPLLKDDTGNTALSRAKLLGHEKIARLLESRV